MPHLDESVEVDETIASQFMDAAVPAWTIVLERALIRELLASYKQLNAAFFKNALQIPTLELTSSRAHLGRWHLQSRTIEISRPLVLTEPWGAVLEVLKHEMAHQYVCEVLRANDESAHGPAFRDTCRRLGIDARASGMPVSQSSETRIVERIAKLLALAESPNQHEAEAAAMAAQRLMLKYNLEAVAATQTYGYRHLGEPSGRVSEWERMLAMILGRHFFVEVIWVPVYRPRIGKRASVLEICGSDANLAMAEYVHAFLSRTASHLWQVHKRERAIDSNRDRRTFLAGVMAGFSDKLAHQSKEQAKTGLVWVKDGDLFKFLKTRHPYIRHVRHGGQQRNDAYADGRAAGRKIVLHKPVNASASHHGRLLKS